MKERRLRAWCVHAQAAARFLYACMLVFSICSTNKLISDLPKAKCFIAVFHFSVSVMGGISGGGSLFEAVGLAVALSSCVKSRVPALMGR